MKSHQNKRSGCIQRNLLRATGVVLASSLILLAKPLLAADFSFSGESTTYLRMKRTVDKQDLYPVYEYLNLKTTQKLGDGSAVSFYVGAWGRLDLADKTTDKGSDADLQYGYLTYWSATNNLVANLGRQFVAEGVATERIDGLYVRSDLAGGFGASAFVGKPVVTEPNSNGGDIIYGARLTHSLPKYYTLGLSALKSDEDSANYREEEGIDIWLYPAKGVDVTGRSTYNSLTSGWMEHAYTVSYAPLDGLKISADLSNINYRDYFFHVTSSVFSLNNGITGILDPNEKLLALGGSVSYTPMKNLTVVADYKNYGYDLAGDADYYGGKVSFSQPASFSAGIGIHRMNGEGEKLRYTEYRLYLANKLGHADLTADFINQHYDRAINGINSSFAVTGAVLYEITEQLKVGADVELSRNPDFDNEARGLVKVIYAFDMKHGEGRGKSEK